jgi:hypothetical protein
VVLCVRQGTKLQLHINRLSSVGRPDACTTAACGCCVVHLCSNGTQDEERFPRPPCTPCKSGTSTAYAGAKTAAECQSRWLKHLATLAYAGALRCASISNIAAALWLHASSMQLAQRHRPHVLHTAALLRTRVKPAGCLEGVLTCN